MNCSRCCTPALQICKYYPLISVQIKCAVISFIFVITVCGLETVSSKYNHTPNHKTSKILFSIKSLIMPACKVPFD